MKITYKEFLEKVTDKLSWVADEVDFMHPYTTRQGKYENGKNHPFAWTCGFYGGIIWNLYKLTGDEKLLISLKDKDIQKALRGQEDRVGHFMDSL